MERFEKLAKKAFQQRGLLNIQFLPRFLKLLMSHLTENLHPLGFLLHLLKLSISYFEDGLYASEPIETALKETFGSSRGILDYSHATTTGTRIGLPVATVGEKP